MGQPLVLEALDTAAPEHPLTFSGVPALLLDVDETATPIAHPG